MNHSNLRRRFFSQFSSLEQYWSEVVASIKPPINLVTLPSTAFFSKRESVPWQESAGRIAAGLVTPYPPGIPLIVPGQLIEQEHIDYLRSLANQKLTIQGLYDGELYVQGE